MLHPRHRVRGLRVLLMVGVGLGGPASAFGDDAEPAAEQEWFKGNTHTHTYWSDGNAAPEIVVDWYARHGYDFLVLSDHNLLSVGEKWFPVSTEGSRPLRPEHLDDLERRFGPGWVVERQTEGKREMRLKTLPELRARFEDPDAFILIQGEEITDKYRRQEVHINGLNLAEVIRPQGGESARETIQRNIDAVIEQGRRLGRPVLAHLNHPNFRHSLTVEDVAAIRGERFFEVYNGHRGVLNHGDDSTPSTEEIWDRALTLRLTRYGLGLLYGLATDDAHEHHGEKATSTPGRGWGLGPGLRPYGGFDHRGDASGRLLLRERRPPRGLRRDAGYALAEDRAGARCDLSHRVRRHPDQGRRAGRGRGGARSLGRTRALVPNVR